jgi:GNAT superfamily N-acetyltransferase
MISEVQYTEILDIRHQVMYPEKDRDYAILPDDDMGLHIGYLVEEKPISIVSLFLENGELQFRKFATLTKYQKQGYGSKLLEWIIDYAKDMHFSRVWCNSRIEKTDFYKKFGFEETNEIFERDGRKYIILEKKFQ